MLKTNTEKAKVNSSEILALNVTKSFDSKKNNAHEAIQESWVLSLARVKKVKYIIAFIQMPENPNRKIVGVFKASNNGWTPENMEAINGRKGIEKRKRQRYTFHPISLEKEYPGIIGQEFAKDRCSNPVRYFKESEIIKY